MTGATIQISQEYHQWNKIFLSFLYDSFFSPFKTGIFKYLRVISKLFKHLIMQSKQTHTKYGMSKKKIIIAFDSCYVYTTNIYVLFTVCVCVCNKPANNNNEQKKS